MSWVDPDDDPRPEYVRELQDDAVRAIQLGVTLAGVIVRDVARLERKDDERDG